jgi:hypothetical protein
MVAVGLVHAHHQVEGALALHEREITSDFERRA